MHDGVFTHTVDDRGECIARAVHRMLLEGNAELRYVDTPGPEIRVEPVAFGGRQGSFGEGAEHT